jgi:amino acid adenylation domain-containing protein
LSHGELAVRRLAHEEARRHFDLQRGPLIRLALLRLARQEHALLLTLHHIVSDGWSMEILVREIAALYAACREERPSPLPPLPIQYADFSVWQRSWMTPEILESQLRHWCEHLKGAPPVLELPSDRLRPAIPSGRGGVSSLPVPAPVAAAITALARREGVTLFMALLAAFGTLLHRYTGRADLVIGTDVANRDRVEIEGLIGFFVNQLALRLDMGGDPPFLFLLKRVREVALAAYAHKDLPFERLVEELRPPRDLARNPVFQVALTLEITSSRAAELPGLSIRPLDSRGGTARFDLSVSASTTENSLRLATEHSAELFDDTTAQRLLGHLATLLAEAAEELERPISELPLLTAAERQQALVEWNDSSAELPRAGSTFTALFAACAAAHPEVIAVAGPDRSLTYRELEHTAGRLAAHLVQEGVKPGHVVPLLGVRSTGFLVAMLGIFKAGAVYLPLDPLHPAARRAKVLSDCGAAAVLCDRSTAPILAAPPTSSLPARLLVIEDLLARADPAPAPPPPSGERSLAYVIYTSGSTGVPKGAMVEHRGMLNHLWAKVSSLGLTGGDIVAQTASQCFDISVWQFLAPLLVGARAHVLPDEVAHDPRRLLDDVDRGGITVLEIVPSLLHFLLSEISAREENRPSLTRLRWLIPTGEELPPVVCRRWFALYPDIPLLNAYGPTECSDDVTHGTVRSAPDNHRIRMPIGRPVPNLRLYVLGHGMRPVPAGIPGELVVGGAGVGRGYLGVGEWTARSWVPDPFSASAGERLYRTGDLARLRTDGEIEFLGRIDHQVKIRGHRIELGEIEAVLAAHPDVRAAAVAVREDAPGQARLVAYAVPHPGGGFVEEKGLRAFASERLPEWMVPSSWVLLDGLPLTPNGKLDRNALPAPEPVRTGGTGENAVPTGPFEEMLAAIFAEVLGLERVGVHDDFFALGGHSLLATQVISRLRRACAVELPLRALFEEPTVAGLAVRMGREKGADEAPPILPVPRGSDLPLSFSQQRLWFLDRLTAGSPLYNIPAAMRLEGPLNPAVLSRALSEVARRHEALRTTFPAVDGEPVQVIHPPSTLSLPVLDLSALPAGARELEAARRISEEATRPFDLAAGPLLRTILLRRDSCEHILVLTAHHIVTDGWSTGVFARELSILYPAFLRGEGSPLPELAIQYVDFSAWQRRWLSGERLARRLAVWRTRLAGAPAAIDLPTDRLRPAIQTFRSGRVPVRLSMARGLRDLAHGAGATVFMALLAGFQTLLSRYSGQHDVVVGTPIAGRERRELEELIGVFINSLPLRGDLKGTPSFRELLERSRDTALEAYSLQGLPFEKLVEELRPARDLARSPLFQVMLMLQNAPIEPLALPDLHLEWVAAESGTTKFELTLSLAEVGDLLLGNLEYNADLFDRVTAERLAAHLGTQLAAAVASPEARVDELPLLTGGEHAQLLREWNDTAAPLPETCVHELFAAQAARTPETVAVAAPDGRSLTYRELDHRAEVLARQLRSLGVGPETRVALALNRSVEMVFAVLGILKAGGAYVPIDLSHPAKRMAFVMEDCGADVLITHRGLDRLDQRVKVLHVEDVEDAESQAPPTPVRAGGAESPDNLAYVLYTSGSTGTPKGVMVPHGSLTNYLLWALRTYPVADGRGMPVLSPLGFDLTVTSLFLPLLAGRTAFLLPEEPGVDSLAAAFAEGGFGLVKLTPTHLDLLAERLPSERAADASAALVLGGEALTGGQLRLWTEHAAGTRVINEYGPTEATVGCCVHEQAAGDLSAGTVPIGRPIANARLHLLDRGLQPVPAGVSGEIYIAGASLARGYAGRPALTAERFVPDPLAAEPGARLYRTGDLSRRRADGVLEFLGRIDHQLKIRGHRIEPGEVEAVLCRHPSVAQAAVATWGHIGGDRRLGAWIVPAGGVQPDPAELRAHLRAVLPEPMVPSAWTVLPALPLTANGKLDRAALPAPVPAAAAAYEEPLTAGERVIAEVWRDLLGIERIGRHENFFDLGGHSLLMARVQSRLRDRLGREIGIVDLFSYPTVASVASWLSQSESATDAARQKERAVRQAEREDRGRSRLGQLRRQSRVHSGGT